MYIEIREEIIKIEYLLGKRINLFELGELESILFKLYNDAYYQGMNDALSDYDSKFLEDIGIRTRLQ